MPEGPCVLGLSWSEGLAVLAKTKRSYSMCPLKKG